MQIQKYNHQKIVVSQYGHFKDSFGFGIRSSGPAQHGHLKDLSTSSEPTALVRTICFRMSLPNSARKPVSSMSSSQATNIFIFLQVARTPN